MLSWDEINSFIVSKGKYWDVRVNFREGIWEVSGTERGYVGERHRTNTQLTSYSNADMQQALSDFINDNGEQA